MLQLKNTLSWRPLCRRLNFTWNAQLQRSLSVPRLIAILDICFNYKLYLHFRHMYNTSNLLVASSCQMAMGKTVQVHTTIESMHPPFPILNFECKSCRNVWRISTNFCSCSFGKQFQWTLTAVPPILRKKV